MVQLTSYQNTRKALMLRTVIPALLSVILFGGMIFIIVIPSVENRLITAQKLLMQELVGTAADTLSYYHELEKKNVLSREQAQDMAWGDLANRRFGPQKKDYFWICSPNGRILKHPYRPDLENITLEEMESIAPGMAKPGRATARIVSDKGAGYHSYAWQWNDNPNRVTTKLTYVQLFPAWQWVVGAGMYVDDIDEELSGLKRRLAWSGGGVVGIVLLLSAYMVLQTIRLHKERHTTWQALSDSEAKHRTVLQSAPNPIVVYDKSGIALFTNPAFARTFGWHADELLGSQIDFIPPEYQEETRKAMQQAFAEPDNPHRFKAQTQTRNGKRIEVIASVAVLRDAEGAAVGTVVNLHDLTQIKAVEQALVESEMVSRAIADAARDAIIMVDDKGDITFWNKSGYDILGYTAEEVQGRSLHDILAPKRYHAAYFQGLHQFRTQGTGGAIGKTTELTAIHKNGVEIPVELSLASVKLKDRWHGVGILRDITERKRIIERSQKAQRLESLGTLAGGIAHDFNNLLMGIQGRTSLLQEELPKDFAGAHHLHDIAEHVDSARSLTRQLLGFARSGKYEVKPTNMNALIQKSAEMFGRTRKEVRLQMRLLTGSHTCAVDRGQIEQVLLNIYVNAWQAMPAGGGELTIQTAVVTAKDGFIAQHETTPGDYVKISITDNGTGMTQEVLDRIFEPFFTTKEMGRGTGLGLASAYGIVKNHGGFITVESHLGQGTRFDLYLPAVEDEAEVIREKSTHILHGTGTILLVDDEQMILEVGEAMMAKLGYEVLTAAGGHEALETYRNHSSRIDLVILDMIMPDMGGDQLLESLKTITPAVKVLLSSGYGVTEASISTMVDRCTGFIQKPFDLLQLSHKLREVLDNYNEGTCDKNPARASRN